jgi:penicillin amidase
MLTTPNDPLWRNASRHIANRDDALRAAMQDADTQLRARLGNDPTAWQWGQLHQVTLQNQTLGTAGPAPVQWLLNAGPYPIAGGPDAVDATSWDARDGYAVTMAPSMRMVVDMANLDASQWINQTGESGHAGDGDYADQTPLWLRGQTTQWAFSKAAVDRSARHHLRLLP